MTDAELIERFPTIEWHRPMLMLHTNGASGYACRFCIAQNGFKPEEIAQLPKTEEPVIAHIKQTHSQ